MILTIAIPTYNRPDRVRNTISRLLPQLTSQVKIMVLDNCSDVNVKDHLKEQIGGDVLDKVQVIRHRVNIGGDANFQRCFELCDTPYIWMLGDDDMVETNAIELIFEELNNFKDHDLIGINFNSNCCKAERKASVTINGTKQLVEKLDYFGNWLFISTSIYKTDEYLKHIRYQAWGAYSMASQLVAPMLAISNNKTFVLSEKYIVSNIPVDDLNKKWSDFQISLSITSLLEANIGFTKSDYKEFGKKLKHQFVLLGEIVYSILKSVNFNIDLIDDYHIYIYRQIFHRTIEFRDNKLKQKMIFYGWLFFLRNKFLLKVLWRFVPHIRKRAKNSIFFHLFKR
ncbi:MAG: glycosyltransferase family A protein [Segetibacter sp.]